MRLDKIYALGGMILLAIIMIAVIAYTAIGSTTPEGGLALIAFFLTIFLLLWLYYKLS